MHKIFFICLAIYFVSHAQEQTINVVGEARFEVFPDYAECEIGVVKKNQNSLEGLNEVNEKVEDLFALIQKYNIDTNNVSIQKMSVDAKTRVVRDKEEYKEINTGYEIAATYRIVIDDIEKCESFIQDCFRTGINHLEHLTYRNSDIDSLNNTAYQNAIINAEKTATAILTVQGRKLGRLLKVSFEKPENYDVDLHTRRDRRWGYTEGRGGGGTPKITIPIKPAPIFIHSKIYVSYGIE